VLSHIVKECEGNTPESHFLYYVAPILRHSIQQVPKARGPFGNAAVALRHFTEVQLQRTSRVWKRVAVVTFLVLGSGIGHAQNSGAPMMTAERSWQIQSVLQSIDADREAWVNLLVSKWASVLNPAVYDAAAELGSVARVAPAWQVYGASLAPDFLTASAILRGTQNAGPYIAGTQSASAAQFEAAPKVIGDNSFTEQVYNAIAPCRVVDTRGAGARTGIIVVGTTRTFDLTTEAEAEGQGGGPFPCTNLPSFHHIGWAVNITIVGTGPFATFGALKAWPFSGPEPIASVLNWMPGQNGAIANGLILTGCPGCIDSINIKPLGTDVHVIIDVMGFFSAATFNSSTVTRFVGTGTGPVASGSGTTATGAACPAGTSLVGGDLEHAPPAAANVSIGASGQASATTWGFQVWNSSGGSLNFNAYSRCIDTPVKLP
jgi:hypothetical protein